MSSPATPTGWKKLLLEAKKHYGNMRTSLYRLTKVLSRIYDHEEFVAECRGLQKDPHDWLDAEFPDLPFRVAELLAILKAYPDEQAWKDNKLSTLADAIPTAKRADNGRKSPRRITVAEYEAVCKDRDHFKLRTEYLEKQVAQLTVDLSKAREQITRLEGRLEEAEKLQPATA